MIETLYLKLKLADNYICDKSHSLKFSFCLYFCSKCLISILWRLTKIGGISTTALNEVQNFQLCLIMVRKWCSYLYSNLDLVFWRCSPRNLKWSFRTYFRPGWNYGGWHSWSWWLFYIRIPLKIEFRTTGNLSLKWSLTKRCMSWKYRIRTRFFQPREEDSHEKQVQHHKVS